MKPRNGYGNSGTYLLTFNLDDPNEYEAHEVLRYLASKRKAKQAMISFLLSIHEIHEKNGKVIDFNRLVAKFVSEMVSND